MIKSMRAELTRTHLHFQTTNEVFYLGWEGNDNSSTNYFHLDNYELIFPAPFPSIMPTI